jgi:hypothetical protein
MPVHFTLDADLHAIRTTLTGTVSVDEVIEFVQRLADTLLMPLPELYDARGAEFPWTVADLRRLKAILGPLRDEHGAAPVAVVAADDVTFDLAGMYGALARDHNPHFAVFRSMAEAEAWLRNMPPGSGFIGGEVHVNF